MRPLASTVRHAWHLARRFAASVRPGPPSADDDAWVRANLTSGERFVWDRMSNPDRRHAAGVARAVAADLGTDADRPVIAAAVLHDSGKVVSGLRTPARVAATLLWATLDDEVAMRWADRPRGWKRRLGQYRLHPSLGAELLAEAGSDPLTVAWTREHHLPAEEWTVPLAVASVLKACDDD